MGLWNFIDRKSKPSKIFGEYLDKATGLIESQYKDSIVGKTVIAPYTVSGTTLKGEPYTAIPIIMEIRPQTYLSGTKMYAEFALYKIGNNSPLLMKRMTDDLDIFGDSKIKEYPLKKREDIESFIRHNLEKALDAS
ncbi:MAG TPA: hypothetical protein VJH34_02460 [archaeon]|nr:hypothetical protein [archaeon]